MNFCHLRQHRTVENMPKKFKSEREKHRMLSQICEYKDTKQLVKTKPVLKTLEI